MATGTRNCVVCGAPMHQNPTPPAPGYQQPQQGYYQQPQQGYYQQPSFPAQSPGYPPQTQYQQPYQQQGLFDDRMIGWWTFDQEKGKRVLDSSGHEAHGELVGNAKIVEDPQRGKVLELDGSGDWVDCGNSLLFDITREITLSAWIKVRRFDKHCQAVICRSDNSWRLQRYGLRDEVEFACEGLDVPGTTWGNVTTTVNVNDGQWHHLIAEADRHTGTFRIYLDGRLDSSGTGLGVDVSLASDANLYVGGTPQGQNLDGAIEFLRIARGTLAAARTTIEELYAWQFHGPFLHDFTGRERANGGAAGALCPPPR